MHKISIQRWAARLQHSQSPGRQGLRRSHLCIFQAASNGSDSKTKKHTCQLLYLFITHTAQKLPPRSLWKEIHFLATSALTASP